MSWTLDFSDTGWLTALLGAEPDLRIDAAEEHHGGVEDTTVKTVGTVTRIAAVRCRYAPRPGTRTVYPAPGSGVLTEIESADGWTPDQGDLTFVGYVVNLSTRLTDVSRSG